MVKYGRELRVKTHLFSASVFEDSFEYLDAPVERITLADVPMAYAPNLEKISVPQAINHIINSAAKSCYMSSGTITNPIVFSDPNGAAAGVGAQHSQIEREGNDVTITAYAKMVGFSLKAAEILAEEGISAEVINLRSIRPVDKKMINDSVRKTNRLVTVEEGFSQHGVGAEISESVFEDSFEYLDAPDVPMAYAPNLEKMSVPQIEDIVRAVKRACFREVPKEAAA